MGLREEVITESKLYDDDGNLIVPGDTVTYFVGDRQYVAEFIEKESKDILAFKFTLYDDAFRIKNSSIREIFKCNLKVVGKNGE